MLRVTEEKERNYEKRGYMGKKVLGIMVILLFFTGCQNMGTESENLQQVEKQENGEWLGYNMISITHYTQRNEWLIAYSHAVDTPTNGKRSIFMAVNILIDGNDCSRIATEACE